MLGGSVMVRKFLLLLAIAGAVMAGVAGSATALPGGTTHVVSSNNWQGLTFVLGLGSCDLFRAADPSFLVFRDVNLTDELNVTFEGGPLFVYNSTATLHGVINTPDGRYTVAGHFVEENNERSPGNAFIATSGHATISGPNGVVSGAAKFQDLGGPPEFDLNFTSLTVCNLK
jgi:hypothetical protein